MKLEQRRIDYKWAVVAACFMMVFVCLGFCSSNKSLYLGAITEALGIKRSLFSLNDSFRYIASAIINLYFGKLVQRFGTRKLILFGFVALIASMLVYTCATTIFVFYIGGCLLGVGLAFTTTAMISVVIKRWCPTNTGTVLGVVMAANGLGGALAAQIISPLIYEEGNPFGYRKAYMLAAVIVAATGIIVVSIIRDLPKDAKDSPEVSHKKKPRGSGWIGVEFREAIRLPYFVPSALGIFLTGLVLSGINGISGTQLKDMGLSTGFVALVLSCHSVALTVFKFLAGVCYDKKGLRTMLTICDLTGVVVMVMLALVTNTPLGMALALLWGVFSALALPMETIGVSLVACDLFGNKDFDKMVGIMLALNYLGYAVGNPLVNAFYDVHGSYKPIILLCAGILLGVTIMYQFVISAAHKKRQEVEAAQKQSVS